MNAVIYARYSSDKQRDASIEDQIRECTEYAQDNSLTVIKTYADRALSGTTDERAQFQLMIKDAAKKQFTQVLIYKTDRFARNRFDAAIYKKKLKDYGVKVVPVKEPIPDGPGGVVMEALYESMAQMYSENLSENVRRGMDGNARKCMANGRPLFGYKIDKTTRRFVVDETQAPVLKHIFEMAAAGKKYAEILKYMADLGYHRYNNWLTTTFRNRRYLGIYIYKDIEVPGGMPQLVDQDTFDAIARILKRRSNYPKAKPEKYLLSQKAFCGYCGKMLVGNSGCGHQGNKYRYYRCKGKGLNHSPAIRAEALEETVALAIKKQFLKDNVIRKLAKETIKYQKEIFEQESNCTELRHQLADVQFRRKNVFKAIESGFVSESLQERLHELEGQEKKLLGMIATEQLKAPRFTEQDVIAFLSGYKNGEISDPFYSGKLIEVFADQVFLFEDYLVVRYSMDKAETRISLDEVSGLATSLVGGPSRIRTYDQAVMSRRLWTN